MFRSRGEIKWHGERVLLSEVLAGEIVVIAEDAAGGERRPGRISGRGGCRPVAGAA